MPLFNVQLNLEMQIWTDITTIDVPTLILHGLDDHVCLFDLTKSMHDGIKGLRLVSIEKAGHGFYYEERETS